MLETYTFRDVVIPERELLVATDPSHPEHHVVINGVLLDDTQALKLCTMILFAVKGHPA